MSRVDTKKCLIVGLRSSLGKKISEIFSSNGYEVIGTSREVNTENSSSEFYLDLEDPESLKKTSLKIGKLDVVIFCSGLLLGKSLNQYDDLEFDQVININVIGLVRFLQLIESKIEPNGRVLFLSSIAAFNGSFDPLYASSKAALTGLAKAMAKNSTNGITFNCLALGLIKDTTMYSNFRKDEIARHIEQTPLKKLGESTDVAKVCFDLCQNHWSHLTGQVIHLNGGRYL